jgi:hypothetical protein
MEAAHKTSVAYLHPKSALNRVVRCGIDRVGLVEGSCCGPVSGRSLPKGEADPPEVEIFEGSIAFNLRFLVKFDAYLTGRRQLYDAPWAILFRSRPTVRQGREIGGWG